MRYRRPLLACLLVLLAGPCRADDATATPSSHRGWGYLVDRLVHDGVPADRVRRVVDDPRMPPFAGLHFSANPPREPASMYRRYLKPATVAAAQRCRASHADVFEAAERAHGVPASLVAAILYVESGCGHNAGSSPILPRLARLAMANAPANLADVLECQGPDADAERIRARARYLEDTFYPEVRATFAVADRLGVDPLEIRGSTGGAFGYPQFLPTSYLEHGIDADGDGTVSLDDMADASASCASYLVGHGWRAGLDKAGRRAVLWQYNHSPAYIDAVLTLASRIDGPHVVVPPGSAKTRHHRSRPAHATVQAHRRPHRARVPA